MKIENIRSAEFNCSCFSWQVGQTNDRRSNPNTGQWESTRTVVFTTDQLHHYLNGDEPPLLRRKIAQIFGFAIGGIPVVRLPLRSFFLLSGSWASVGYQKASTIWMQQCIKAEKENHSIPRLYQFCLLAASCIAKQLIQDVIKCAALPLVLISLVFACVWGFVNPYDGRKLIGMIEDFDSIELPRWADTGIMDILTNHIARCMQDIETWKRKNLFRHFPDYHPHTLRGLLLSLKKLHKEGLLPEIKTIDNRFQTWRAGIEQLNPNDGSETDEKGNLKPGNDNKWANPRQVLLALLNKCNEFNQAIVDAAASQKRLENRHALEQEIENLATAVDQALSL